MMILKEHNISVRLPQERAIDTGIVFVQNDKDVYKLNVRVFDGDNEIDYSQVESATITFLKADGTVVQGDMQKATNMLTYYLGTNEIAAPGKLIATIQLLGANERLTTARFLFRVEKDLITEDAVKSTSEFPILQKLKKELEEIDVVDLRNDLEAHKAESAKKHITESGSNANGEYIKFDDGTMICTSEKTLSLPITNTYGSIFSSSNTIIVFPATFIRPPSCSLSQKTATGGYSCWTSIIQTKTSLIEFSLTRGTSNSAESRTIGCIAVGRWK